MRLDKFLCECGILSRSEASKLIKKKHVTVNGDIITDCGYHIDDDAEVLLDDRKLTYSKHLYIILNKPAGYVTAREDKLDKTVMELINVNRKNLSPVGRLDKDTEGLLLITDNGKLNHNMLSPAKHVDKTYFVQCRNELSDNDIKRINTGLDIGDDKPTLPAVCKKTDDGILLTIHEGRYHQIKRMLKAVENEVVYLKRISFGPITLDTKLKCGEYRYLTKEETDLLKDYM